jgi:hypothetical protein
MAYSLSRRDAIAPVMANLAGHGRRPHLHQVMDRPGKASAGESLGRPSQPEVLVQRVSELGGQGVFCASESPGLLGTSAIC